MAGVQQVRPKALWFVIKGKQFPEQQRIGKDSFELKFCCIKRVVVEREEELLGQIQQEGKGLFAKH